MLIYLLEQHQAAYCCLLAANYYQHFSVAGSKIITITINSSGDSSCIELLALMLLALRIIGGRVATFAYAIFTRGTYLDNTTSK